MVMLSERCHQEFWCTRYRLSAPYDICVIEAEANLEHSYNSAVFARISASDWRSIMVSEDVLPGAPPKVASGDDLPFYDWSADIYSFSWLQNHSGTFDRLELEECAKVYSKSFISDRGDFLLVLYGQNVTSRITSYSR